jgi:hypothetical protein
MNSVAGLGKGKKAKLRTKESAHSDFLGGVLALLTPVYRADDRRATGHRLDHYQAESRLSVGRK